jgi:hypothetical protein
MREFHEQQMADAREAAARAAAAAAASPTQNGNSGSHGGSCDLGSMQGHLHLATMDSPPLVEVKLPNGVTLPPAVLAKVAATAATAAATALNEVLPQRNGATTSPVCTIASYGSGKGE